MQITCDSVDDMLMGVQQMAHNFGLEIKIAPVPPSGPTKGMTTPAAENVKIDDVE